MRISDWSSDVCSSDLHFRETLKVDSKSSVWNLTTMSFDIMVLEIFLPLTSGAQLMIRSEEHTSELQSLMRISYAVFCLNKKKTRKTNESMIVINTIIIDDLTQLFIDIDTR